MNGSSTNWSPPTSGSFCLGPARGPNRPVVKSCSPYPRLLSFYVLGVDSCVFFYHYDKSRPENQTKRGEIDLFRTISKFLVYVLESFSLRFLFEKNRFPGDPQKHYGNSGRLGPLTWADPVFTPHSPRAAPIMLDTPGSTLMRDTAQDEQIQSPECHSHWKIHIVSDVVKWLVFFWYKT